MPLTCWVMPIPHTRQEPANGGLAYQRAAWAMSRFGTPVTRSACSSVNGSSDCRQVSNPSVRARTKSRLARPSSRITFAIALKRVTSVPGRWAIQRSAWLTSSMRLGMMAREPIGGEVERLVPRGLAPAAVDLHERRRDAIARVDEPGPEAALHAQRAQARAVGGSVVGHDRESTIGADVHADPAAHATIGARGLDAPVDRRRRLLRPERARRTRRHALAARRADRRRHGAIAGHADLHPVAAPQPRRPA